MSTNEPKKHLFGEGLFYPFLFGLPILMIAAGGVYAFRGRGKMMASLETGEADGRAFATADGGPKSASACLNGALDAMGRYGAPPEPGGAAFLESCLATAGLPKTGGAKQSAPTRGFLERWTRDECAARGHAGDPHCTLMMQLANLDPCAPPFVGVAEAKPPWTCNP